MNTGLVFGIVFAIIIIGMLLAFGLDQIINIFCVNNIAQVDKSVKDLENAVENVFGLGEGSALPFKVAIPRNAKICLIDYTDPSPMNTWNPDPQLYNSFRYEIEQKQYNVWVEYGCGTNDNGYRISHLKVTENFCVSGGSSLYVENMGHYVAIERPPSA